MLFDIDEFKLKSDVTLREPPPLPPEYVDWQPPREFPNLSTATVIAFDTETYDPYLTDNGPIKKRGPGWARGKGHIVGVSLAAIDHNGNRGQWYFPMRHEMYGHLNLPVQPTLQFLRDALQTPHIPKVGANLIYDVGWLSEEGVFTQGVLHDVQFAEALLKETGVVSLDYLGQKYLQQGKDSHDMYNWIAKAYGGEPGPSQRRNIYRTPPQIVGAYAEADATLPLDVLQKQWPLLQAQGLMDVYRMECDLIYLWVRMRRAGVQIDLKRAEQLHDELAAEIPRMYRELGKQFGYSITSASAPSELARLFDKVGVNYPRTPTGKPSFKQEWLDALEHPVGDAVNAIRQHEKVLGTFIRSYLLESHVNGKLYGSFQPLRTSGDKGKDSGTRSGRVASNIPNLQNIPSRTILGKQVRTAFVPDHGHVMWKKYDYSQIEYRMLVHHAVGDKADMVRRQFCDDLSTDYHKLTQKLVRELAGLAIERPKIKNINFGLLYGMGIDKLARTLNVPIDEARTILEAYHTGNPYVRATMEMAIKEANDHGYVCTILGRRSRFDEWEPEDIDYDDRARALPYDEALSMYGPMIKRAYTHKAINRKLQGGAADMMKRAMWQCWKDGVFDLIGVPRLTVHDELDFSDPGGMDDGFREMQRIMETCLPLKVPVIADLDVGLNWGECMGLDDLHEKLPGDPRISYLEQYESARDLSHHLRMASA